MNAYVKKNQFGDLIVCVPYFIPNWWFEIQSEIPLGHRGRRAWKQNLFRGSHDEVMKITEKWYGVVSYSKDMRSLMKEDVDHWKILGLRKGVPYPVAQAAWRAWCKIEHPDAGGDEKRFRTLNEAWERIKEECGK